MADLRIQLETDYELYKDFEFIEGSLVRLDKPWQGPQKRIYKASPKLAGGGPAIVMGFSKVKKKRMHHLYLRLLDRKGSSVAFKLMNVKITGKQRLIDVVMNKGSED